MRSVVRGSWALALLAATGTGSGCHSATDPTPPCYVDPPTGTNQAALYKVAGPGACGTGATSVTAVPNGGTFAATIRFRVKGAKPNTTYFVQRAAEFPPNPTSADTTCQRADQLPPRAYKLDGKPSALLTDPRAADALAAAVRKDLEADLRDFDIEDKATLRSYYGSLANFALLEGRLDDAIALAMRMPAPIFVEDDVVRKAHGLKLDETPEGAENLRKWLETLSPEELGKYKM